jgi:Mce-associated membrane protein
VDQSSNPDEQGEADEQTAGDEQTTADERDEWPDWQPPNLAELQAARATAAPDDEGTSRLRSAPAAGGGRWVIATAVATAAAIGLLLALLFNAASPGSSSDSALGTVPASALTAARSYSVDLAGYNYRHLDQDFGVVLDHSTAPFKESFTRSSDALRSTLLKYHATATAKVVAAGVVSASVTQVVVLVFLDQTVTNTNQKGATTDRSQIEITLVPSGSSWLINGVILL